jgi:hypothetical protein
VSVQSRPTHTILQHCIYTYKYDIVYYSICMIDLIALPLYVAGGERDRAELQHTKARVALNALSLPHTQSALQGHEARRLEG